MVTSRVGHLILKALAIRASDHQNVLACTSFHSPKPLRPPPRLSHFTMKSTRFVAIAVIDELIGTLRKTRRQRQRERHKKNI